MKFFAQFLFNLSDGTVAEFSKYFPHYRDAELWVFKMYELFSDSDHFHDCIYDIFSLEDEVDDFE